MGWSEKYKKSIDCNNPKGFSQRAHCQSKNKRMQEETKSGDEGLRDWFGKSKSKGGKPGWVQLGGPWAGKPCARQPGQKTVPKCGSSKMAANLTAKEEEKARRRKMRQDKDQPKKRSGAKPTYVATEEMNIQEVKDKKGKGSGTKDACYHKVKSRYSVWPSAYASGALVKCRKVGAANWGNKTEEVDVIRYCPKCDKNETRDECKYGPKYWDMFSLPEKLSPNNEEYKRDEKCPEGKYWCFTDKKCKKIPSGYYVMSSGRLMKDDDHENGDESSNGNGGGDVSEAKKCWKGYEKKGTQKLFGKTYNRCVKKEENKIDEMISTTGVRKIDSEESERIRSERGEKKKAKEEESKKRRDLLKKERKTMGIRFYDKKGSGYIKDGKKQYDNQVSEEKKKDHEYSMARSELSTIVSAAKRLRKKTKGEGQLKAWVQSKITKAADYIDTAADYMDSGEVKESSFSINQSAHKKMQKLSKIRNLTGKGTGGEKDAAQSALKRLGGGPSLPIVDEYKAKNIHGEIEVPSGNIKKLAKRAVKRIDMDVDGDVDKNDPKAGNFGEYVPTPNGKKRIVSKAYSNWRKDLGEDWQKVNKSDKTDGMSAAAVKAYRRENPGSKLKTAVTGDPKPGSKDAKRRKSFCARSKGQQDMHNIDCSKTPDKPICKARRRWKC